MDECKPLASGGLESLFDLVRSNDEKICLHAVSCCKRLSSLKENQTRWPASAFPVMLGWLDMFQLMKLQMLTLETITNLCEESDVNRERLVNVGPSICLTPRHRYLLWTLVS